MRDVEEIREYINNSKIAGRWERKNIREFLRSAFPEDKDFTFRYFVIKDGNEITYQDFKNFANEQEDI
jgi:hypothetical protein